jgi:hypothetical protein
MSLRAIFWLAGLISQEVARGLVREPLLPRQTAGVDDPERRMISFVAKPAFAIRAWVSPPLIAKPWVRG